MSASRDGSTFTPQRWSTPVRDYRTFGARRLASYGEGRWHTTDPQGQYAYLEYHLDAITCNPHTEPADPPHEARPQFVSLSATENATHTFTPPDSSRACSTDGATTSTTAPGAPLSP